MKDQKQFEKNTKYQFTVQPKNPSILQRKYTKFQNPVIFKFSEQKTIWHYSKSRETSIFYNSSSMYRKDKEAAIKNNSCLHSTRNSEP